MRRHRRPLLGLAIAAMVLSIAGVAWAAAADLYLMGDGVPGASMSLAAPASGSLPDFDGDGDPGLTLKKGGSGPYETDATKYQEWEFDASGLTFGVNNLTLWVTSKDMKVDKDIQVTSYLFVCSPGCNSPVDSSTRMVINPSSWKKVTMNLSLAERAFGAGEKIVVKVIVTNSSDDDAWLAYGTATYSSNLMIALVPTTTTTTTTIPGPTTSTTTVPGTTTTVPGTTTTQGHATTTTLPHGPPTTAPTTTTTTVAVQSSTTLAPTTSTSTTIDEGSVSTTLVVGAGGSGGSPDDPSSGLGGPSVETPDEGATTGDLFSAGAFDESRKLRPQVGLMAAYATVAENIRLYWQVAIALGALMTVLLLAGFEDTQNEEDPGRRIQWNSRLKRI